MKYIEEIKDKYTIDELKHSLFRGDNREILKTFPNECVDLIYMDPPFFSGRKYTTTAHKGEVVTYSDIYVNSDTYIDTMGESITELHRVLKPTGSIYLHCDWRASHKLRLLLDRIFGEGEDNFRNEIIWCYKSGGASKSQFSKKHDSIFFYSKSKDFVFNSKKEKSYMGDDYNTGNKNVTLYDDNDQKGKYTLVYSKDWWKISMLPTSSKERIKGFKTQKPMELLEKIIKSSSNKGDIILDPFMGSGTTLDAAYSLGRIPIGIDLGLIQINITLRRCDAQCSLIYDKDMNIYGMTGKDIEDYNTLIENVEKTKDWDWKRFQRFAVMLNGGILSKKFVADGNVDGRMSNGDIIQVKQSENVGPGEIQKLFGTLTTENQTHGILIAYSFTNGVKEAIKKGQQNDKNKTIEAIRIDEFINIARVVSDVNKEIEQEKKEQMNQQTLDFS